MKQMKSIAVSYLIIGLLTGCHAAFTEQPTANGYIQDAHLVANIPDTYSFLLIIEKEAGNAPDWIESAILKCQAWDKFNKYSILREERNQVYRYDEIFQFQSYPHVVITDHEKVVLVTNEPGKIEGLCELK